MCVYVYVYVYVYLPQAGLALGSCVCWFIISISEPSYKKELGSPTMWGSASVYHSNMWNYF